jgi:hypothetical protein
VTDSGPQTPDSGLQTPDSEPEHGPLYYLFRNVFRMFWKHKAIRVAVQASPFVLMAALYLGRAFANPKLVVLRQHSPMLITILFTGIVMALPWTLRSLKGLRKVVTVAVIAMWIVLWALPFDPFRELSLYYGHTLLDKRPLEKLPLTDNERIYPLSLVKRIVEDRMTQSHVSIAPFEMLREKEELSWVAQKTPAGAINQMTLEEVSGLVKVAASSVTVNIEHIPVKFPYGRDLFFLQDLNRYLLPRKLGFLDIFDKQIDQDDVTFVKDDKGKWVAVVSVIDWDGLFPFCIPRFGGVFVCPQKGEGDIRYYSPEEIAQTPHLRDQNLLPEDISSFYAEGWKFNQGFMAWVRNRGVTKITTIPEDTAQQPFSVFFRGVEGRDGLFQFFALEPEGKSSGLSKMLLFDPSGSSHTPVAYVYDFDAKNEELVGPERIAETIKSSDLHADWKQRNGTGTFIIAESRPYIKDVAGHRVFRWFNSIITDKQGSGLPLVVLADPKTLKVEWFESGAIKKLMDD